MTVCLVKKNIFLNLAIALFDITQIYRVYWYVIYSLWIILFIVVNLNYGLVFTYKQRLSDE